jgi:hypothetical protein
MSFTKCVPALVPSVTQSSVPVLVSCAGKKSRRPTGVTPPVVPCSSVCLSPYWVTLGDLSAPEFVESDLVQWMDPQFRKLLVAHVVDVHDPSIECAPPRSPR